MITKELCRRHLTRQRHFRHLPACHSLGQTVQADITPYNRAALFSAGDSRFSKNCLSFCIATERKMLRRTTLSSHFQRSRRRQSPQRAENEKKRRNVCRVMIRKSIEIFKTQAYSSHVLMCVRQDQE